MGLLGVGAALAMRISDGFKPHILHQIPYKWNTQELSPRSELRVYKGSLQLSKIKPRAELWVLMDAGMLHWIHQINAGGRQSVLYNL